MTRFKTAACLAALVPVLLGGCVVVSTQPDMIPVETATQLPDMIPVASVGQEQVCAAAWADRLGVPMSAIRANGTDTAPNGNTVVFLQTADLASRATCEVNAVGNVMNIISTM